MLQTLRLHLCRHRHLPSPAVHVSLDFAKRLKNLRKQHNLTQEQLATRFGIDHSFIQALESGQPIVPLTTLSEPRHTSAESLSWAANK